MKFYLPVCICCVFFSLYSFSQRTIKGRIVNEATGEALPGSSIFINSTSIGTVADKNGSFELNNIPSGRYDLVISAIGFETNTFNFTSEQLPLNVKIEMKVKVKELENVTVEPFTEESWGKWGKTFIESFIGTTPNSKNCSIKNTGSIHFRYYKKSNRITAYSDEPLIIENKALGYNIRYQLEQFEIDFSNRVTLYTGYPFFEEIDKNRKGLQRRWKEARIKAYNGSLMHFFRCLFQDSLIQNGYEVRRMKRIPNYEKQRVKIAYQSSLVVKDSAEYYRRILRQKDYTEVYSPGLLTADSLIVESQEGYKSLFFSDFLFITYKKELEDKEYLLFHSENRRRGYQQSYTWLVSGTPVTIDVNGNYYPPQEVFSMSYWGWNEKIANLLPSEYKPGD